MSYILDALRKADAERERDPARGIHAQPMALATPSAGADSGRKLAFALAGVVLVLAGGAWLFWSGDDVPDSAPLTLPSSATAGATVAVVPQEPAPAAAGAAPASVIQPAPMPLPRPAAAPESDFKAAHAGAPAASARAIQSAEPAPAKLPQLAATPTAAPAASDRILSVGELPAEVQRELPRLVISGGVHSDNASQRMLIVGGQVVNEGTELAPGLRLEEIRSKSAVMRFRGYRYSVAY